MRKVKKFTGIRFSLFSFDANRFYGYGFAVCTMSYDSVSWVTHSHGGPLFSIYWNEHREKGGREWRLHICLFFFHFDALRWVTQPQMPRCACCYDNYATIKDAPYCSAECKAEDEIFLESEDAIDAKTLKP